MVESDGELGVEPSLEGRFTVIAQAERIPAQALHSRGSSRVGHTNCCQCRSRK